MMNTPAQASPNVNSASTPETPEADVQLLYEHQIMASQETPGEDQHAREAAASPRIVGVPETPARLPVIRAASFSEVYQQAGIRPPAHGFTILKIVDMVSSNHLRDLSREGKRAAILMALEASNVELQDVIDDGAQRDLALNEHEAQQQKVFQDFKTRKQQQNQETQAEMERLVEACRATIQANEKEIAEEKARLDDWRAKKREEERRMRTAASHFVATTNTNTNGAAEAVGTEPDTGAPSVQRPTLEAMPTLASANGKPVETRTPVAKPADKRVSLWKR